MLGYVVGVHPGYFCEYVCFKQIHILISRPWGKYRTLLPGSSELSWRSKRIIGGFCQQMVLGLKPKHLLSPCSSACWFTLHSGLARFHSPASQCLKIKLSIFIRIPSIPSLQGTLTNAVVFGWHPDLFFLLLWTGVYFLVCVVDACVQAFLYKIFSTV